MENPQVTLVTQCLWEFQEMTPEVDGVMLIGGDGIIVASTLSPDETTTQVADVVLALVRLAREAIEDWEQGNFQEVRVRYRDDRNRMRDAQLISAGHDAVLVLVLQQRPAFSLASISVPFNTRLALRYLTRVLEGDTEPPPINWM